MKQQVVVIHGGETFATDEDYLEFLKTREVSGEDLRRHSDWKDSLAHKLGEEYEVLLPRMPNGTNAKYLEWQLWWERLVPLFETGLILVGHSLGGIFLAKYLAENAMANKVKATLLVAAPFDEDNPEESLADFILPGSLDKLAAQGGKIYIFHSQDDPVVPVQQAEKYRRLLPQAEVRILDGRGHFNQENFPELAETIKSLI